MWFDPAVVELIRDSTPVWLVVGLVLLSFFGSATLITPLLVCVHWLERRARTLTWIGIVFGSYALRSFIKSLNSLGRPPVDPPLESSVFPSLVRPLYAHPVEIATTSFPSGHVMTATVFWGLFVVDTDWFSTRVRFTIGGTIVAIVGVSRVVVGAHYPGDVVGGLLIGVAFLAVVLWLRARTTEPVAVTIGTAGLLAAAVLSFSSSETGEWVLGVSIGILLAWYWPVCRSLVRDHRNRPVSQRVLGTFPLALGATGIAITALGGHDLLGVLIAIVGGVVLVAVGRSALLTDRLASIGRRHAW
ncbi:phosphatase PAP2 family protein [Halovivax gelatinilyticus]|uniref:phosphatase PAP2 family protein n=1 Tax=Halovivax gelatinilyticus TaxID=2961597 RepID=UPI0020CA7783|nr:phosphatase PAP2 family protein [Halovivax gelatinilyticus]